MSFLAAFIYLAGSVVCHQLPERSFHYAGVQLPVCARCTGLYLGGAIGMAAWIVFATGTIAYRTARWALLVAALPTAVTLFTAQLGSWDPGNSMRAALAFPLGVVAGAIVVAGLTRNLR